jgi:hypothetical protein
LVKHVCPQMIGEARVPPDDEEEPVGLQLEGSKDTYTTCTSHSRTDATVTFISVLQLKCSAIVQELAYMLTAGAGTG